MKTLLVKYLPSGEKSKTATLMNIYKNNIKGSIEEIDLLKSMPPIFDENSMTAYRKRNYMGEQLTPELEKSMLPFDNLVKKVKSNDIIVICCPMHNFSFPGIVKCFIDAIILAGETFDPKTYSGLMKDKKALTIFTAGGDYSNPQMSGKNMIKSLGQIDFEFMGFSDIRTIGAGTANPVTLDTNMKKAEEEILAVTNAWYK